MLVFCVFSDDMHFDRLANGIINVTNLLGSIVYIKKNIVVVDIRIINIHIRRRVLGDVGEKTNFFTIWTKSPPIALLRAALDSERRDTSGYALRSGIVLLFAGN